MAFVRRSAAMLIAAGCAFTAIGTAPAYADDGTGGAPCRAVIDAPARGVSGDAALDALADAGAVGRAAAAVDMTSAEYTAMLREDPRMRVDDCAETFAVDPARAGATGPQAAGVLAAGALDNTGDAFALASRPGSAKTLFLDFRARRLTGTAWNSWAGNGDFTLPAFSLDGDAATFSASEQNAIREIWMRVAEDFAPFDVNVTTADPGPAAIDRSSDADGVFGTRAIITNDTFMQGKCGCGGIAYVGVFDYAGSHEYFQPALVFAKGLSMSPKYMAEAASHEVGHNLGLSHDGRTSPSEGYYRGHGSWAPIMGVGYYEPVSQWSRGEYANANNTEDDLAVIAAHGPTVLADDRADTAAGASDLPLNSTAGGIITTRADVDYFRLTLVGTTPVTVTAQPQTVAANLDAKVSLYDAAGTLLAAADPAVSGTGEPATGLAATLSRTLAAGTYYVAVDGVGFGRPTDTGYSDYASLGRYSLSATGDSAAGPLAVTTTTPLRGTVGSPYGLNLAASGGTAPYGWSLAAGSLPAGLSLSPTGSITGTPTAAGTATATVRVTDSTPGSVQTVTAPVAITVLAPLVVTSAAPGPGTVGAPYSWSLTASGGTGAYTWSQSSGSLPAGLSLSAAGVLSGTPIAAGTATITARVTDASAGLTATASVTVSVVSPVRVAAATLPVGTATAGYPARALAATGGSGDYRWAVTDGALPAGMSLGATGALSGIPAGAGTYRFSATATDSAGRAGSGAFTLTVLAPVDVRPTSVPDGRVKATYAKTFTATGGTGSYTWTKASGTLPTGLTLSKAGKLSGTPTKAGTFTFTVRATDTGKRVDTRTVTVRIAPKSAAARAFARAAKRGGSPSSKQR